MTAAVGSKWIRTDEERRPRENESGQHLVKLPSFGGLLMTRRPPFDRKGNYGAWLGPASLGGAARPLLLFLELEDKERDCIIRCQPLLSANPSSPISGATARR